MGTEKVKTDSLKNVRLIQLLQDSGVGRALRAREV